MTAFRCVRQRAIPLLVVCSTAHAAALFAAPAPPLEPGRAKGSIGQRGRSAALTYAYAFVDPNPSHKAVILYLTDKPLPPEVTTDDIQLTVYRIDHPASGVEYSLDPTNGYKETTSPTVCVECKGIPTALSNLMELKFDAPPGKVFAGTVRIKDPNHALIKERGIAVDVAFHAVLK